MKKLVTAGDILKHAETSQKNFYIEPGTIVTPAAKDAAEELNICLVEGAKPAQPAQLSPQTPPAGGTRVDDMQCKSGVSTELVAKIVREVMASLTGLAQPEMIKEADPGGLRLVKGNTVVYEKFNTGAAGDGVRIKEIFNNKECPNMAAGFMTMENTSFKWDLKSEEINYIIEGTLDVQVNGTTYRGEAGDVFYLPKDTTATFAATGKVRLLYISCPPLAGAKQ